MSTHNGYQVGDEIIWENPYGIDKHVGVVAALHRNGNLLIRNPEFGTTVDVHCTKVERVVKPVEQSMNPLAIECPNCHSVEGVECCETVNGRSIELRSVEPHWQRVYAAKWPDELMPDRADAAVELRHAEIMASLA